MSNDHDHLNPALACMSLDESFYNLDKEQREFLKHATGIQDDGELKKHVMEVQASAYKIFPYPCIRWFAFAKLAIAKMPNYDRIIKLPQERPGAILLDLGCCFGSDLRKAVFDGWPVENAVASDLFAGLWEHGHKLYKTDPATFPVGFVQGDAFKDETLSRHEPLESVPAQATRPSSLTSVTSLNPLRGHVDAIHTSLLFHLFDEDQQLDLARRVGGLLSPKPGSVIFGGHYGRPEMGKRKEILGDGKEHVFFWHSPETWKAVWSKVFREGTFKVEVEWSVEEAHYVELQQSGTLYYIRWCVTRL